MNPHWLARIPRVIAHVSQQGAGADRFLVRSCREVYSNETIAIWISHMGIIRPDLGTGMQRVRWNADNDGRLPISLAGEKTIVSCINGCNARLCTAEDIDTLMAVPHLKGISPQISYHTVRWKSKMGRIAMDTSRDHPIRVLGWILDEADNIGGAAARMSRIAITKISPNGPRRSCQAHNGNPALSLHSRVTRPVHPTLTRDPSK